MSKLQLYTWYKIEDYTMFKNMVYEYFKDLYAVDDYDDIDDITSSKAYRCVEHICEEQKVKYIKILELDIDHIRYTIKFHKDEQYVTIPLLHTSSVTNMFSNCNSLQTIPQLDISEDTNPNYKEENKMIENRKGAFTLLENYYNEKLNEIDEESLAAQNNVIEGSDAYQQYKIFKDFIDKRAKELNMLFTFCFDVTPYLSIDEQSALKEIADYTQNQKDELIKECKTINALLEMTNDYDKQIDILTRYGVITLPKKRK